MNAVHPTAVFDGAVEMGRDNVIGPYAVILGPLRLGDGNWVGPHVVLGTPAEIRGVEHGGAGQGGVGAGVRIGSRNVIREYTTVHQGWQGATTVGDGCFLMNRVYIGHDGSVQNDVTMAAGVSLGGHVQVGAAANLGMGVTVHQHRIVGPLAMIGMSAVVTRDVPPFALAYGNPCRVRSANRLGMLRAGYDQPTVDAVVARYSDADPDPRIDVPGSAAAWAWWEAARANTS
jgi:UDP-N-acetylglucosamine acyltransferase